MCVSAFWWWRVCAFAGKLMLVAFIYGSKDLSQLMPLSVFTYLLVGLSIQVRAGQGSDLGPPPLGCGPLGRATELHACRVFALDNVRPRAPLWGCVGP